MSNTKQQKPTLTGQRFKTRKRDEKEKFEPSLFRDAIVQGLEEAGEDLEAASRFLDVSSSKLDYRRYADTLFDILVAGGMLAPGGSLLDDGDKTKVTRTNVCLFSADEDLEAIRRFAQVICKLLRRYKYLEKCLEEEFKKLLMYLKGFTESEQNKLAMFTAVLLGGGHLPASVLGSLFTDSNIKEGLSAAFSAKLFRAWIVEKDMHSVTIALKRSNMDKRLPELFPANKRDVEHLTTYFTEAGLPELASFLRAQQSLGTRMEMQKELQEKLQEGMPVKEVMLFLREEMKKNEISEARAAVLIWTSVMSCVEWNKKEELVTEQAIKHLKQYAPLFAAFTSQPQSELALLLKVQEYCYDNIHFMKTFQKIIVLLYKADILSEETILKWHSSAHAAKGKTVFLDQTKKFVEWLQNAEEESDSEED
uniref:eIF5-mimic protein 1-like n=1 Tax=Myxine glutinosa TaxID=7769 RepID=UPI00358F5F04